MAHYTILFIFIFLNIICYPHTTLADQVDTEIREPYPSLGSLVSNHGTVHFIAGVMIATVKLESQIYIENQLEIVFTKGLDILTLFRHGGISLSGPQKLAIENEIREASYSFHKLLQLVSYQFIKEKLGFESVKLLEEFWRQKAYESLASVNIAQSRRNPFITQQQPRNDSNYTSTFNLSTGKVIPRQKKNSRSRRGLINIGGDILHSIFGVSTDKQVEDAKNQAHNEYLRILNSARSIEVRAEKAQHRVTDALTHLEQATQALANLRDREDRVETFLQISSIWGKINNLLLYLLSLADEVGDRITLLQSGQVPPIVNAQQLTQLIKEGADKFNELVFPYDVKELNSRTLTNYLSLLHVQRSDSPYLYYLLIPFVADIEKYKLYKIEKFPIATENKTLMINQDISPFLAVSQGQNIAVPTLEHCNKLLEANSYLCDLNKPKLTNEALSCELALIKNDSSLAKRSCQYAQVNLPHNFFATYLETKWYIFFSKETIATITCPEQRNNRLLRNYKGTIVLHPPCHLSSKEFSLSTVRTSITKLRTEPVDTVPIFEFRKPNYSRIFDQNDLEQIDKDISELNQLASNHSNIINTFRDSYAEDQWHIGHTISSTFILMIIVVGVISIILCRHAPSLCARIFPFAINTDSHLLNNPHVTFQTLAAQGTTHRRAIDEPPVRSPTTVGSPAPLAVSRPIDIPRTAEPASPSASSDYHPIVREYLVLTPTTPASATDGDAATSAITAEAPPKPPRVFTHSLTRQKKRHDLASPGAEYVPMVDIHPPVQLTEEMKQRIDRMQNHSPAEYELTL